ncbi:MAG: hypothetical protein KDC07_09480 [Chitinophagaceae bacterium]|nr:hypothetical protein [Chitinophagaceae bacterium]
MKKIAFLIALSTSVSQVFACSVCGCSASNQYLGILPQSKSSFIGTQYQYRVFNSNHVNTTGDNSSNISKDHYSTVQLWGRYNISKKVQAFAFIPYIYNEQVENSAYTKSNGVGDVTVLINYRILATKDISTNYLHNLLIGGGIKLPTGKYDGDAVKKYDEMPNMQPGTGSFDFIGNANYTVQHNKNGVNVDVSYTATTANVDDYKFGNRLSAGCMVFRTMKSGDNNIIPQFGFRYDINSIDYNNYYWSIKNTASGGHILYTALGVQYFHKRIGCQFKFSLPIAQHYADGKVQNKYNSEAGLYVLL